MTITILLSLNLKIIDSFNEKYLQCIIFELCVVLKCITNAQKGKMETEF